MAGVVEQDVFVALDDAEVLVGKVFGEPLGGDELFRMGVFLGGDGRLRGRCGGHRFDPLWLWRVVRKKKAAQGSGRVSGF